jgi:hypothetical protein
VKGPIRYFRIVFHMTDGREVVAHSRSSSLDDALEDGHEELRKLRLLDFHDHAVSFELSADEYEQSLKKDWTGGPSVLNEVADTLTRRTGEAKKHNRN